MYIKRHLWTAVLLFIAAGVTLSHGRAQESYAAAVNVVYEEVAIRRANTRQWLPLRAGAQAPLGAGDALRTNAAGRAFVRFGAAAELYLLPNTTLEVLAYGETPDGGLQLGLAVRGVALQRTFDVARFADYRLVTDLLTVTRAAEWFGVWAYGAAADVMTVAAGEATIRLGRATYTIPDGHGFRVDDALEVILAPFEPPYSAARFEGALLGCKGVVQLTDYNNINVRVGPGLDYTVIGYLADGSPVQLMGITESRRWYRIQAFNGFGWLRSTLIETACTSLPTYPNSFIENNLGLRGVTAEEQALLAPFYGQPQEDRWFFISWEAAD